MDIFPLKKIKNKIFDINSLEIFLKKYSNKKIVFTNGCFDLLHYWHLYYLAEASRLGDIIIVGMNSNSSISKIKWPHRPINDEKSRLFQIASLEFIDGVILFTEETPKKLIELIRPHVLVKGGDYEKEEVVGWEIAEWYGGTVKVTKLLENYSTTNLEKKILLNN